MNVLGCFVLELLRFRTHLFYCQAFLPALIKTERTIAKTNKFWISNFSYFNKPEPKFQYLSLLCSIRLKISLYINVVFKNGPCSNFSSPKNSWNLRSTVNIKLMLFHFYFFLDKDMILFFLSARNLSSKICEKSLKWVKSLYMVKIFHRDVSQYYGLDKRHEI